LREQRQGQCGGYPGFAPQLGVREGLARAIRRSFGGGVAAQDSVIAGALDCGKQLAGVNGGTQRGRRALGGEIDAGLDARNAAQRLFDACRAGSAGHPFEAELDLALRFEGRSDKRGVHASNNIP